MNRLIVLFMLPLLAGCGILFGTAEDEAARAICVNTTPPDMLGPYFIENAPQVDRIYPADYPGETLIVSGTVFDADCNPLPGAIVEVWQADSTGEYDFSDQFIGRGQVITDENGFYQFETIVPGRYEPRPPHIHYRISHPDAPTLVTQLYFSDTVSPGIPDELITSITDGRAEFSIRLGG